MKKLLAALSAAALALGSCTVRSAPAASSSMEYAKWFSVRGDTVTVISPWGAPALTIAVDRPFGKIVCMSSSYIGYLDAIGCDSVICAVSGKDYITLPSIHERGVPDIGYEASPDYETVVSLNPDIVIAYTVSDMEPQYIARLRSLGVRVAVIYDQMEEHPLARAEYMRFFGALTGRRAESDSAFAFVRDRYISLRREVQKPAKVLVNIPYADQWYIPGGDSYMSQLVRDAGGEVLGSVPGTSSSSVISVERAYSLSAQADFWLDTGWCNTLEQLHGANPLFGDFPVIGRQVWNNTLRATPGGGNDFWESGAARPDLILEDLVKIFSAAAGTVPLNYYLRVE